MESSIKMDINHLCQPYIKVKVATQSEDVRDKLFQQFFNPTPHSGTKVHFLSSVVTSDCIGSAPSSNYLNIEINEAEKLFLIGILDNSDAFRSWLKANGIDYANEGHVTSIQFRTDLFQLGMEWEKYRQANKPK